VRGTSHGKQINCQTERRPTANQIDYLGSPHKSQLPNRLKIATLKILFLGSGKPRSDADLAFLLAFPSKHQGPHKPLLEMVSSIGPQMDY
jgi:hypothetical protein